MKITHFNTAESENAEKIDIDLLFHTEDLPLWQKIAEDIQHKFNHVFIFGVGGSSLAGQILIQFQTPNTPKVKFIDVLDEQTMATIKRVDIKTTAFVFITKSGETLETLVQMNYCLAYLQECQVKPKDHFFVITMPQTPLAEFTKLHQIPLIFHPDISGRYSCFTSVAIFPALIVGVDILAFIDGAKKEAKELFSTCFSKKIIEDPIHVIMPYIHKLNIFTEWYSQLTAESLSKNGNGYCVLRCFGTKDQHNQLQMFVDGQDNKTYTFIREKYNNNNIIYNQIPNVNIPDTNISSIMFAGMHSVVMKLASQGKIIRTIEVDKLNPFTLGQLFAFFIKETLYQAQLLQVDPFTQPGVGATKKLMFEFLQNV
jgi:glucose-6-phosphate isomerase